MSIYTLSCSDNLLGYTLRFINTLPCVATYVCMYVCMY